MNIAHVLSGIVVSVTIAMTAAFSADAKHSFALGRQEFLLDGKGRFWETGPQKRLYCPAPWLKKGRNEIVVFDLLQNEPKPVCGKATLY